MPKGTENELCSAAQKEEFYIEHKGDQGSLRLFISPDGAQVLKKNSDVKGGAGLCMFLCQGQEVEVPPLRGRRSWWEDDVVKERR